MNSQKIDSYYNDYYFAHCCGRPYERDEHWLRFFRSIAKHILIEICPKTVLDAGCAMGFLVEALRQEGVESWGVDISEYAIQKAHSDIQPYCWVGSVTKPFLQKYDLIVSIEVLEHLPLPEVEQAIINICQHTDDILFSSTPFDYKEATHFNVKPPEYWAEQFAKQGFFRDVDFDASFITPWATRFRRNREPWHRVLRGYERKFWLLWNENQNIRRSTVDSYNQLSAQEQSQHKLNIQIVELQSQLQQTQLQLEHSQSHLQDTQAEFEHSHSRFQDTQVELERSQSQLQQTQAALDNSQSQLQQSETKKERLQLQHKQTQIELERSQSQLQQTQMELARSQAQLQHTQAKLAQSQAIISGMESSKFWKLRTAWFRLKQAFGLIDNSLPTSTATSSSPQITEPPDSVAIPEVININEINFKIAPKDSMSGCFDGINGSSKTKVEVPTATPLTASGWAILADEGRPADKVIITYDRKNCLVAVAPINLERLDVAEALNNSAYKNSGWSITLNTDVLPAGQIVLKAWAYNAARKEAILLNSTSFISRLQNIFLRLKYYYAVLRVKGIRYGLTKLSKKIYYKLDNSQPSVELLPIASPSDEPYARWLTKNFPREADLRKMAETVEIFCYKPTISIIMPVYNTPQHFLREAIESVLSQVYPYWELCIADDASTKSYIRNVLEEYILKDSRIKGVFRTENGHISCASNSAIEIATGEFIALLDHDDLLTPDALYEVALVLNRHPEADMIYSDEDKIDDQNQLKEPFFKPDWCPDSFLSRMYTCHLGIYRRALINEIGAFRVGYEGSQDYDLILRLTEKTENIFHIPKVLYHWRIHFDSTASRLSSKSYATDAAQKALLDALYRRGESGKVIPIDGGHHIVRYEVKNSKLVSIIIPTRNLGNILDNCLKSIFEKTIYPNYEVLVIDNGSNEIETINIINEWKVREPNRFRCEILNIPFNYSKINNYAVNKAKGNYLIFLNNDTEVVTPDWINAMVEQAQRSCIGAVGALLLYPDNTIQHAGVVGVGGVAGHSHKHYPANSPGYFNQIQTVNNYSAVTAACLMCRREVFEAVGGFEEKLIVSLNDVDFCLKIVEKGYRNIYLPHVVLYHYESKSRGYEDTPEKQDRFIKEVKYMQSKWKNFINHDPCYSPNLTKRREDFSLEI